MSNSIMSKNPKPIPAVSGLILRGNQVLLVKRAKPPGKGCWSLPGGKMRSGESLEEALIRELMEELGVQPWIGELIGVYDAIGEDYHYVIACFRAGFSEERIFPGNEILDFGWFSKHELAGINVTSTTLKSLRDAGFIE